MMEKGGIKALPRLAAEQSGLGAECGRGQLSPAHRLTFSCKVLE
jgi:hypothetical protein